ncbi:hypothetical protein [Shewanella mangrovi]|uniref:hypothetical protein n=1 Tax=Shewanella mangrovi TaxID=1515746 RepID=UPI000689F70F|nr:hypothetical protein [Shewanella mangrovi]
MEFTKLESGLALAADVDANTIADTLSQQEIKSCIWLTDTPAQTITAAVCNVQTVAFPVIDTPTDNLLEPVVEAIQSVSIDDVNADSTAVVASSYNLLGVWLAYYLMENGAAPVHAVARVRATFEQCFVEDGWDQFVYDVLYRLQA